MVLTGRDMRKAALLRSSFITTIMTARLPTLPARLGWRFRFLDWAWRSAITTTTGSMTSLLLRLGRADFFTITGMELSVMLLSRRGFGGRMSFLPARPGLITIAMGSSTLWWRTMCSGRRRATFIARWMGRTNLIARRN